MLLLTGSKKKKKSNNSYAEKRRQEIQREKEKKEYDKKLPCVHFKKHGTCTYVSSYGGLLEFLGWEIWNYCVLDFPLGFPNKRNLCSQYKG